MGEAYPRVRLAAVQAAPVFLDREATVEKACRLILEAGAERADFVVFPEAFIPAFPYWYYFYPAGHPVCLHCNRELFKNAVEIPGPAVAQLCAAARRAGCYVVMGLNERRPQHLGTLYNTQVFIDRQGRVVGKHQKLTPTFIERLVHANGDGSTLRVFPSPFGPVGGLICGENGNPLFRFVLAAQGERVHAANWPAYVYRAQLTREDMLLRSRYAAWEGRVFVVAAASVFTAEMEEAMALPSALRQELMGRGGGSAIFGPRGEVLAGPAGEEETIIYADVELESIIDAKFRQDFTGHYNRFDVVAVVLNTTSAAPLHRSAWLPPVAALGDRSRPERQQLRGPENELALVEGIPLEDDVRGLDDGDLAPEQV